MGNTVNFQIHANGYAIITLNRPEKRNAISIKMARELKACLHQAKQESIKFLVITGAGNKIFCAGGDLKDLHGDLSNDDAFVRLYAMKEVLYEIASFPVPTICLLNGDALGGGCEIATACDFRIAKDTVKCGFIQASLGITPGWGGGVLLYEKVHASFAYHLLVEAKLYDAGYLLEQGFLQKVVPQQDIDMEKIVLQYVQKSYEQMKLLKRQYLKKISILNISALMDEEVRNCANLWDSQEHKTAVNNFLARKN